MNGRILRFHDIKSLKIEALPLPSSSNDPNVSNTSETANTVNEVTDSIISTVQDHMNSQSSSDDHINTSEHDIIAYDINKLQPIGEKLRFIIETNEDNIILESSYDIRAAKTWLQVIYEINAFLYIKPPLAQSSDVDSLVTQVVEGNHEINSSPVRNNMNVTPSSSNITPTSPSQRSKLTQPQSYRSNHSTLPSTLPTSIPTISPIKLSKEFTVNSTSIYTLSTDAVMVLHQLISEFVIQYPLLEDIKIKLTIIWRLLSEVRFNREVIIRFGEKLEEVVRVLGDVNTGKHEYIDR